jgi:hypothetical protein
MDRPWEFGCDDWIERDCFWAVCLFVCLFVWLGGWAGGGNVVLCVHLLIRGGWVTLCSVLLGLGVLMLVMMLWLSCAMLGLDLYYRIFEWIWFVFWVEIGKEDAGLGGGLGR